MALLWVVNDLLSAGNRNHITLHAVVDLLAAYDTLDRDIHLQYLYITLGLYGTIFKWFWSCLTSHPVCGRHLLFWSMRCLKHLFLGLFYSLL